MSVSVKKTPTRVAMCCRKGDPFQGPKLGSCLTLGDELSEETHVLTKQEILLGKGARGRAAGWGSPGECHNESHGCASFWLCLSVMDQDSSKAAWPKPAGGYQTITGRRYGRRHAYVSFKPCMTRHERSLGRAGDDYEVLELDGAPEESPSGTQPGGAQSCE